MRFNESKQSASLVKRMRTMKSGFTIKFVPHIQAVGAEFSLVLENKCQHGNDIKIYESYKLCQIMSISFTKSLFA